MSETWVGPRNRSILRDEPVARMLRITEMQRLRAEQVAKRAKAAQKEGE